MEISDKNIVKEIDSVKTMGKKSTAQATCRALFTALELVESNEIRSGTIIGNGAGQHEPASSSIHTEFSPVPFNDRAWLSYLLKTKLRVYKEPNRLIGRP